MKRLAYTGLLIIMLGLGSGCLNRTSDSMEKGTQPMEGWQKNVVDARQQSNQGDDPVQELNHWKYGVRPGEDITSNGGRTGTGNSNQDSPAPAYPGLTEKEYQYVIVEMLNLGYLKTRNPSSKQLEEGLKLLQGDNHIPQTGILDQATLKLLGL